VKSCAYPRFHQPTTYAVAKFAVYFQMLSGQALGRSRIAPGSNTGWQEKDLTGSLDPSGLLFQPRRQ
jgi:hypothetical protein